MNLVNLTPHVVNIRPDGGAAIDLPPSGTVVRNTVTGGLTWSVSVAGVPVPVTDTRSGNVIGAPASVVGTWFVVSRAVADAAPERADFLVPHGLVRDEAGRILACRGLARIIRDEPASAG